MLHCRHSEIVPHQSFASHLIVFDGFTLESTPLDVGFGCSRLASDPCENGDEEPKDTPSGKETIVASPATSDEGEDHENEGDDQRQNKNGVEVPATLRVHQLVHDKNETPWGRRIAAVP